MMSYLFEEVIEGGVCCPVNHDPNPTPSPTTPAPTTTPPTTTPPCSDSDHDGVCDDIDNCKYAQGPAKNNGCPVGCKSWKYYQGTINYQCEKLSLMPGLHDWYCKWRNRMKKGEKITFVGSLGGSAGAGWKAALKSFKGFSLWTAFTVAFTAENKLYSDEVDNLEKKLSDLKDRFDEARRKVDEAYSEASRCGYCYKGDSMVKIPSCCPSTMERYCK